MNSLSGLNFSCKQQKVKKYSFIKGVICLVCITAVQSLPAQTPSVTASINLEQVVVNQHFYLTFTFENTEIGDFKPPNFKKDFIQIGSDSRAVSNSIINGILIRKEMIRYQLKARKTGTFIIDSVIIKTEG